MALAGRVAVVTGATRGIGRALALAFASEGADVVVTGKTTVAREGMEGTIYSVADEVEKFGVRALPAQLDVRDDANVKDVIAQTAKELGPPGILVNNASALWWKPIEQVGARRAPKVYSRRACRDGVGGCVADAHGAVRLDHGHQRTWFVCDNGGVPAVHA